MTPTMLAGRKRPAPLQRLLQVNETLLEKAEDALSESLLREFESLQQKHLAAGNRKADMTSCAEMSRAGRVRPIRHGSVPGVRPGQRFQNKGALMVLGVHDNLAQGISKPRKESKVLFSRGAYAIVLSGGYHDEDNGDVITYTGVGTTGDQSFATAGNNALQNNCHHCEPVRVVRKMQGGTDLRFRYIYDGLYDVIDYRLEPEESASGRLVAKFTLRRSKLNQQQPSASMPYDPRILSTFRQAAARKKSANPKSALKASSPISCPETMPGSSAAGSSSSLVVQKKSSRTVGCICTDISNGMEAVPIPAFNEVDNEKLPSFVYITYLDLSDAVRSAVYGAAASCDKWYMPFGEAHVSADDAYLQPANGALSIRTLTEKAINEIDASSEFQLVSRGVTLPLEVFKTKQQGWGVRCSIPIPKGRFICDYTGEVVPYTVAEVRSQRASGYLFDLDHFHHMLSRRLREHEEKTGCRIDPHTLHMLRQRCNVAHSPPLAIDALTCGGVARFINNNDTGYNCAMQPVYTARNHSTIFYRLGLFATRDIPANTELTYCYGYGASADATTTMPEWYINSQLYAASPSVELL